MNSMNHVFKSI